MPLLSCRKFCCDSADLIWEITNQWLVYLDLMDFNVIFFKPVGCLMHTILAIEGVYSINVTHWCFRHRHRWLFIQAITPIIYCPQNTPIIFTINNGPTDLIFCENSHQIWNVLDSMSKLLFSIDGHICWRFHWLIWAGRITRWEPWSQLKALESLGPSSVRTLILHLDYYSRVLQGCLGEGVLPPRRCRRKIYW